MIYAGIIIIYTAIVVSVIIGWIRFFGVVKEGEALMQRGIDVERKRNEPAHSEGLATGEIHQVLEGVKLEKEIHLSNDIDVKIQELYGKTHKIEKVFGTEVLTKDQGVCWGDGKTFYYLLTKLDNNRNEIK